MIALRSVFCAGCFLLGWLGIASLGGPLLPPPHLPVLSEKRAHFLAHAGECDAVFIGSSRVYRGFVPKAFDAAVREPWLRPELLKATRKGFAFNTRCGSMPGASIPNRLHGGGSSGTRPAGGGRRTALAGRAAAGNDARPA